MRRKIDKIVSSCWECPYMLFARGKDVSILDGWNCSHELSKDRQLIDQRHKDEFAEQYPKGFPTWCPLPVLDDTEPAPAAPADQPHEHKMVLVNGYRYDLKDCAAYPTPDSKLWSFFAIRSASGRTTSESYAEYKNFQEIQEMFNRVYGFGAEWKSEPLRHTRRKTT
jgi:hypothetical protein